MIKLLIASGVAASAVALGSPARSEIYVNPEYNGATYGNEALGGTLTTDVGYRTSDGTYTFYIQGGPAIVMPSGADQELEIAGKFGGSVKVNDNVSVYAELSGITGDELTVGSKLGLDWAF
jgi:hypothetical protein|tara:strand:+ start:4690 stop:5052 length:363 start_codon:yes stop_codon:yes gene_type:complete